MAALAAGGPGGGLSGTAGCVLISALGWTVSLGSGCLGSSKEEQLEIARGRFGLAAHSRDSRRCCANFGWKKMIGMERDVDKRRHGWELVRRTASSHAGEGRSSAPSATA